MGDGSINVRLADDTVVPLTDDEVRVLSDALWTLTDKPGALAIVGMLDHERRRTIVARAEVQLSERESEIFREAKTKAQDHRTAPPGR